MKKTLQSLEVRIDKLKARGEETNKNLIAKAERQLHKCEVEKDLSKS